MKGFRKPNDYRGNNKPLLMSLFVSNEFSVDTAMILTAQDAIIRFHCVSAYVQTDEISLVSVKDYNDSV